MGRRYELYELRYDTRDHANTNADAPGGPRRTLAVLLLLLRVGHQRYRGSFFEKQVETNVLPSHGGATCAHQAQEIDLRPTKEVFLGLLFAGVAMAFVFLMVLLVPTPTTKISLNDKSVVSGIFIASCCIGMSLALYPGWIHKSTSKKIPTTNSRNEHPKRSFSGHHPDCEMFQTHRIT